MIDYNPYPNHRPKTTLQEIQDVEAYMAEEIFSVRVKQLDLYSDDRIRQRGVPSTGLKHLDGYINEEWNDVYWTIQRMLEAFENNITFVIVKKSDTTLIYDQLKKYLALWLQHLRNSINVGEIPIDKIALVDRMAEKVFGHSSELLPKVNPTLDIFGRPTALMALLSRAPVIPQNVAPEKIFYNPVMQEISQLLSERGLRT